MDFNKLVNDNRAVIDRANAAGGTSVPAREKIPTVYPFNLGAIEFRLLPNKSRTAVQRLTTIHKVPDSTNQWGSKKVICLNAHYGKECPICTAINNAQTINGKECGAFKKFGYLKRGIAYVIITKIGPEYKDIKPGDLVLLQYPQSVYKMIADQVVKYADNLEYVLNRNEGCTFVLETKKTSSGFPEYSLELSVGFNGPVLTKARASQEEYDALINSLPDINETKVPSIEPENLYNDALAVADLVNVTYGCVSEAVSTVNKTNGTTLGNVTPKTNTLDFVDTTPAPTPAPATTIPNWGMPATSTPVAPANNGMPACFGNHDDSQKCMMCPYEMQCIGI